ncbi:MAG: hypothetical protein MUE45_08470, partial [Methanoregulaceae archaeon]|nr:hypothetical protein [Methanoregulaceae archaeon]
SAVPGSKITITPTVKNTGDASASYSYVYFYLSPDSIRDAGDPYLGKLYLSSLSSGYSKTASFTSAPGPMEAGGLLKRMKGTTTDTAVPSVYRLPPPLHQRPP